MNIQNNDGLFHGKPYKGRVRNKSSGRITSIIKYIIVIIVILQFSNFDPNWFYSHNDAEIESSSDDNSKRNESSYNNNDKKNESSSNGNDKEYTLPKWIENYIKFHNEMRTKFPGSDLFTNPNSPGAVVRVCLNAKHYCGGLNDRLGQIQFDLFVANQTNRVLFYYWNKPCSLEQFLIPNLINWTLPIDQRNKLEVIKSWHHNMITAKDTGRQLKGPTPRHVFEGYPKSDMTVYPRVTFWDISFDQALSRARYYKNHKGDLESPSLSSTSKEEYHFRKEKFLIHSLHAHAEDYELEKRLSALNEEDKITYTKTFGKIFHILFRPNINVQNELSLTYQKYNIQPKHYSAVHLRLRHHWGMDDVKDTNVMLHNEEADHNGYPWHNDFYRSRAVNLTNHAILCARTLQQQQQDVENEPICLLADSNDIVNYLVNQLHDEKFLKVNQSNWLLRSKNNDDERQTYSLAYELSHNASIFGRISEQDDNYHLDTQNGYSPSKYYGTFVDFYLAANARCITFGIGLFASFAAKVSGTDCRLLHRQETPNVEWTKSRRLRTPVCNLTPSAISPIDGKYQYSHKIVFGVAASD